MKFCTNCGQQLDDSSAYCPSCGVSTAQGIALRPPPPPNLPGVMAAGSFGDADKYALDRMNLLAVVMLFALVLEYAFGIAFEWLFFSSLFRAQVTSTTPANPFTLFGSTTFLLIAALSALGVSIEIFSLVQMRLALKRLSTVDKSSFGSPSTLILLAIIAIPFVLLGFVVEFTALASIMSTVSSSQSGAVPQMPPGFGYFLAGSAVSGIGGIISLIGIIGGAILGLWRAGVRYGEGSMKAASILFIIPLANVAAPVLLLLGVRSARRKLPNG